MFAASGKLSEATGGQLDGEALKKAAAARAAGGGEQGGPLAGALAGAAAAKSKRRNVEKEVNCGAYISAVDINDIIAEYKDQLSADDLGCLKRAREELKAHPKKWANADFYVQGAALSFVFYAGGRANKFISYKNDEGKFESYLEVEGLEGNAGAGGKLAGNLMKKGLSVAKDQAMGE